MPWIRQDDCAGCGICVVECPSNAISLNDDRKAFIDMELCIRCGRCHEVCPRDAVRHDSERIPFEVEANVEKTLELLENFDGEEERKAFLERMIRHFDREKTIAEKTIERIREIPPGT